MDEHKICFIMCVNDDAYAKEAVWYIRHLKLPDGYHIEWQCVKGAMSMAAGYNEAMKKSNARYKVYLHQDVMILETAFIENLLHIFRDPKVGMVGMVGARKLSRNGELHETFCVGKVYMAAAGATWCNAMGEDQGEECSVEMIDGLLMATQYDLPWREDLSCGWESYDVLQSQEFIRNGYRVIVPAMDHPWCRHDCGYATLHNYWFQRKKLVQGDGQKNQQLLHTGSLSKYRIWLLGTEKDCSTVEKLLDHKRVQVLGRVVLLEDMCKDSDFVIVCSTYKNFTEQECFGRARLIRFDFMRLINEISPETAALCRKTRMEVKDAIGVVCGMSCEQKGIEYEHLEQKLMCLAGPSQDIFVDYYRFLWAYNEIVNIQNRKMEYCVIGMNDYRLWWDLSLGMQSLRMLGFYPQTGRLHHLDCQREVMRMEEEIQLCRTIFQSEFLEKDFQMRYPHIYEICERKDIHRYCPTEKQRKEDRAEIEHIFDKPYPETYEENIGIFTRWFKFLQQNRIKTILLRMPFPTIFRENTNKQMRWLTWNVMRQFCREYDLRILDLTEKQQIFTDEDFYDWSHLNADGAKKATEQLNCFLSNIQWEDQK